MRHFISAAAVISLSLAACGKAETLAQEPLAQESGAMTADGSEMVGEFPSELVFVQDGHSRDVKVGEEFSLLFDLPDGTGSSKEWGVLVYYPEANIKHLKTNYVMEGKNTRSNEVVLRAVGVGDVNLTYAIFENNTPITAERRRVNIRIK